ncbi:MULTISPECIES: hypothetical protein [Streptomyces]|uniref:hypothetical protein n=1 Tax=Streptomyces TaxID=1883 RepID=UPI0013E8B2C8|nr:MULTISPECIES: hypothetical protein [Streptomyces]
MASRASSDAPAAPAPVRIPALPGLGTTWYARGARYWLRRASGALLWFLVLAFFCYAALELYSGFREQLPSAVRTVWDWAQVVASVVALVWGWLVQRRGHRAKLQDPPVPDEFRAGKRDEVRRTTWLTLVGRLLVVIAAPVLPAFAAWAVGWCAAAFTVREYPSEVGARRLLEAQKGRSGTSRR